MIFSVEFPFKKQLTTFLRKLYATIHNTCRLVDRCESDFKRLEKVSYSFRNGQHKAKTKKENIVWLLLIKGLQRTFCIFSKCVYWTLAFACCIFELCIWLPPIAHFNCISIFFPHTNKISIAFNYSVRIEPCSRIASK